MHNVRKVKTTEDKQREKLEQSKKKAAEYVTLKEQFEDMKSKQDYSVEAFKLTTKILNSSSDCYSIWNYRKKILLNIYETNPEQVLEKVKEELKWLETLLPSHPKSYWVWFHRKWLTMICSQQGGDSKIIDWDRELALCTKALDMDQRNFHCWNYRRYVTSKLQTELQSELSYTLTKINQNFSNYSAWHQRSYLMLKLYAAQPDLFVNVLNDELDLVQNAFYTSPEDQSTWFYYRWLIGMLKKHNPTHFQEILSIELQKVNELLEEEPNSKWVMLTTVFLMQEQENPKVALIKERLDLLKKLDEKRKDYYHHLLQKF